MRHNTQEAPRRALNSYRLLPEGEDYRAACHELLLTCAKMRVHDVLLQSAHGRHRDSPEDYKTQMHKTVW